MRRKTKRPAVKNIILITRKKKASSKRCKIDADKNNAEQERKGI